ncbi:major facilitator superfamily domain-containing protein [Podospora fimiseda]|uniref:Major facilitator superfamily domain-containing protein n=1 Tax=Podospora fimiseda TaxID=252190 RepID=A0AAN7BW19_9PEZI|nr:major facilitator superfamily domain-containing protein [Podospora fimiseda]
MHPFIDAYRNPPPIQTSRQMLENVDRNRLREEALADSLRMIATTPTLLSPYRMSSERALRMTIHDQRHPGKPGAKPHRSTRQFDPSTFKKPDTECRPVSFSPQPENPGPFDDDCQVDKSTLVTGFPLVCLMVGLMLAVFLISIDRTIISTAIPYITSEFQSTPDIGWYGSAYLLTACAFQPVFGRIFTLFSVKKAYLVALLLFELGSLMCGMAPNSMTLIVGRAMAGWGCAGVLTGSFVVVSAAIPLHLRPVFMAVVGLMFGVGASVGPLLGGVFTDLVSWRWCFYVNLPVGGVTAVAIMFFFSARRGKHSHRSIINRFLDLDIVGNVLLLGACIMLFLALEFTTTGVPWSSAEIIGLLVGSGVVSILLITWQHWKGEEALMPPRIVTQRTVAASCGMAFMTYGAIINLTFFLPIWFQAINDDSAIKSGVNMIPYFVINAFFSLLAGVFVSVVGYVTPPAVIGSAIGTAGLGLMTLLNANTTTAQWVGYQILASAGFGISIQQGFSAVQTVLDEDDMAIGTAAVVASQSLGGAIFLSVGNSVFQNQLIKASHAELLPGLDIKRVIDAGAASFRRLIPDDELPIVLHVYNDALRMVFMVGIPLGVLAAVISCFIEWKSVKVLKDDQTKEKRGV